MTGQYTIIVINDKGSPVREATISKKLLTAASLLALCLIVLAALGTYRYLALHGQIATKGRLLTALEERQNEIEEQKNQIRSFAETINDLKNTLMALNEFEEKIRVIANLEHKPDQASLFAIGGSMPEDIDPSVPDNEEGRLVREMHRQVGQLQQVSDIQQTSFESLIKSLENKKNLLASTPSLRPARGWVSSNFGYRVSPFTGRRELHKGIDIANRVGTPIIAPAEGVVTFAGEKWLYGNLVTIDHGHGIVTYYGHIQKWLKKKGERVKRGETIALIGNVGRSTGPHVHYEVRLNGVPVDPKKYIFD